MKKVTSQILHTLVRLYQIILSPYLGGRCRFTPSCSEYALAVIKTHPPHQALFLIIKRLGKCHPLGPYGFDLPPSKQQKNQSSCQQKKNMIESKNESNCHQETQL